MSGFSARVVVRRCDWLVAASGISLCAAPSSAASARFDVPSGPLGGALIVFGRQAGLTIGISDPRLAMSRTTGVRGRHSTPEALRRLLQGTGATFVFVDPRTVRIVVEPSGPRNLRRGEKPRAPETRLAYAEIIVTGSKQRTPLDRYAGTVTVIDFKSEVNAREASRGTDAIVSRLPMLATTNLGPGRNKLFVRGVADSSFNGPSQATVGQYLGDVRLTYNAPDPDLNLYDIGRIEVLEGPQGTLYGTGALGGIIRLVPNAPDSKDFAVSLATGVLSTRQGGIGGDAAAMLNVPIAKDRLAARAVGYWRLDPGYIDDSGRGLRDVNRTKSYGARLALSFQPDDDWTMTLGGAFQNTTSRDGQYGLRGLAELTRASAIAQPFDNDYRLAYLSIGGLLSDAELISTTAVVRHDIGTVFDATGFAGTIGPVRFEEDIGVTLLSHETRISWRRGRRGWIAGVSGAYDISRLRRQFGGAAAASPIAGVRNQNSEAAVFGEYSFPVFPDVSATLGGRATYSHVLGILIDKPVAEKTEPRRRKFQVSPAIALSWQGGSGMLAFARYQEASRAGGLTVAPSGTASDSKRFEADSLGTAEIGFRLGVPNGRWSASATLSYARWSDIQADLIDLKGLPYTTNIGNGRIYGFEAQLTARPIAGLTLEASTFLNDSALSFPAPDFLASDERDLPNIAQVGGSGAASYTFQLSPDAALALDGKVRYVGRSRLAIGMPFEIAQGNYTEASIGARLAWGGIGLSIDIANLTNERGNRFAYGNPFSVALGDQVTPLRPRTIRIGFDGSF